MTTKILSTLSVAFFLFFSLSGFAQSGPHKISGKVMDEEMNVPLEFATVSVVNANEPADVTGVVTNSQGNFSIEVPEGTYNVIVEFISYETKEFNDRKVDSDINLGTISLGLDSDSLDEVVVQAETTQVSVQLDKKIYNIGKDLTTAGGTVSDALNNVPSVSVDVEGGISLRGNQNVRILINGKPSAMAGFGDSNVLSQLPAEAIERVEVITSPSARYDAEGTAGILNIILRQKETLGFNGSVNLNLGHPDNAGLSTNLNYRTEKFNLFTNIGWRYFDAPQNNFSDTEYLRRFNSDGEIVRPEYDRIREERETERLNRNYNGNFGIEYFLTEQSSLTASIFYRYGEDEDETLNNSDRYIGGSLVEETLRRELQSEEDNSYQISINYQNKFNDEGHELTADFQYENDAEVQNTFINEEYISTNQENPEAFQREEVYTEEDQKEYLIQADYVLPLGEDARFEAGYRGNFENEITDYRLQQEDLATGNLVTNDTLTNIFDYEENVNALYSQYGTKFGKFSFLLGLRLENTQLKGDINSRLSDEELVEAFGFPIQTKFDNNYLGLFPTVNLIYELSSDGGEEENITVGYNRRINRPRGWYINPFPSRSSRTNVFQGNPNLQPAFASAFDIGYLKRWDKITFTSSVYYQHETDSFERVEENTGQETTDGIDIIRTIPINLATNKRTGGELGILYNPADWLRLNSSFNFFQFETEGEFNGVDYGAKNTSWFARFSSKVTLPGAIDWQTNAFYRGPQENAQTKNEGIFSIDLAFSKEILNDNVTLSLNVRDLLNSRKRKSFTSTEFFNRESEFQWRQRQINLSVIYRFNQQKREQRRGGEEDFDDPGFEG
ncbi:MULTISPECIES: TonB-dependent receptor [Salegentibacter]|uniref:Outer membrane receptor proteins, mostly Fe transport n=1 Tax=Salegentibacter agarivorans TaxID=345907 RepID=A0A1I2K5T9_9FLAO|nr:MULTISPECIES: TonB-dependent receptor [Salegentibacter]APS39494.1 TonB-dependent receptor [Salegentibacter sp. T436]SFF62545.1 Outer membrane receptor proteins, mostly Fe transport [Salegentibacter agarivorans]